MFYTLFPKYLYVIFLCKSAVCIMFLCIFRQFNQHFKTFTQSLYIASSHINIRTRNKISAGVLIIRSRNNYTRGRACHEFLNFFSKKSHSAESCRTVPKMRHSISLYIETTTECYLITLTRLHILIHAILIH